MKNSEEKKLREREYRKKYRFENPDVDKRYRKNHFEELKVKRNDWVLNNFEKNLLGAARRNARSKKLEFSIELSDIVIPETCPVFGFRLEKRRDKGYNQPSLDRIDNTKGYVKGNVWVISYKANRLKNNATLEELRMLVKALEKFEIK